MDEYAEVPAPEVNREENILADRPRTDDKDFEPNKETHNDTEKTMNPIIKGILFTALSGLKMFVGTIIAGLGVPQNDQDSVVALANDLVALIEGNETPTQALLDAFDPAITILQNVEVGANADVSLAISAFVGALQGLKSKLQPK